MSDSIERQISDLQRLFDYMESDIRKLKELIGRLEHRLDKIDKDA
jgi:hypothetical protein